MPCAVITGTAIGPVRKRINWPAAVRHFVVALTPAGKHDVGLQLRREGADQIDAGGRQDLRHDDQAELDLALGDELGHDVGLRPRDFRFDGLGDAEALEHGGDMKAAPDRQEGDRLRLEQGALERVDRTDIRLWRTRAHFDADARARDVGARRRDDLPLLDPGVDRRGSADDEIEGVAGGHAPLEIGRQAAIDMKPMARLRSN